MSKSREEEGTPSTAAGKFGPRVEFNLIQRNELMCFFILRYVEQNSYLSRINEFQVYIRE